MSNWKLKRARRHDPPPDGTVTIVNATKPNPTKRKQPTKAA
jgi:hypothetical protein